MHRREFIHLLGLSVTMATLKACFSPVSKYKLPNIVFIMADDMGYGDPGCYNPESKTPTPNIDRLARQGLRFTNAHSPGALCIPARYGLLTGRYPFRSEIEIKGYTPPALIEPGRATIATILQQAGYYTGCVGKWHLGFDNIENLDSNTVLTGGPCEHGFNEFFGMHASLDIPPYFYIKKNRVVEAPSEWVDAHFTEGVTPIQGEFWRAGKIAPGFRHDEVLKKFTEKSIEFLEQRSKNQPFFLYVALAAPHTPWLPEDQFKNSSQAGMYGDFVTNVDHSVGQILNKLQALELENNTLVIFTSDNGPVWFPQDEKTFNHRSTYFLRGMKADAYEGGHRMPFIARWPGKIQPGTETNELICFTDMLATFATIANQKLPPHSAEDSYDITPVLFNQPYAQPLREATVIDGRVIIRWPWKLIFGSGLGGISTRYSDQLKALKIEGDKSGELYNLELDPSEKTNLYEQHPDIVENLKKLMDTYRQQGFSVKR